MQSFNTALERLAIIFLLLSASFQFANPRLHYNAVSGRSSLIAPAMTWIDVTKSPSPPILAGDAMIFDQARGGFLLFGGQSKYLTLNELWFFNPSNLSWSEVNPLSSLPIGRADPMFVWLGPTSGSKTPDTALLFGGWYNDTHGNVGRLADTWYYFPRNNSWSQLQTSGNPSGRSDSALAFDPQANRVLMYGGYNGTSYLNDLWSYFPSNRTWQAVRTTSPSPPPLADARMRFDTDNSVFVLFGGNNNLAVGEPYNHYDATWTYNPSNRGWSLQKPVIRPPARDYAHFAYDPAYRIFLLQGGYDDGQALTDTWIYSYTTDTWVKLNTANSPPGRFAGVMDYALSTKTFLLFGGGINDTALNDTWILNYVPQTKLILLVQSQIHAGDPIQFSTQIQGNISEIASYFWDFGDGINSTRPTPIHTYSTNGTFQVTLKVTDALNEGFNSGLILTVASNTAGTVVLTLVGGGVLGLVVFVLFLGLIAPRKKPA